MTDNMSQQRDGVTGEGIRSTTNSEPLLKVEDLYLYFGTANGMVRAVDGVSFHLGRRQSLTVVGESGCGKTSLARAILRLLPRNVHTYSGRVIIQGDDVMQFSEEQFRKQVRWTKMSLVSQAAMNSLNPVLKVGEQVMEPLMVDHRAPKDEARQRARAVFNVVGIPEAFLDRYAFELSGGMRQRAIIAMALMTNPPVVILDEPTSALDVLTQANIMNALKKIKQELELTFILITHDIATSSDIADEVVCMYAGQIVEHSKAEIFYRKPLHPYAQRLMASVPTLRADKKPEYIPGQPPSLVNPPQGCRFAARCDRRFEQCQQEPPVFRRPDGIVKCWLYQTD